ncbi:hypothetical protein Hanom_Chr04g00304131 [Helianthus anomalus]
MFVQIPFADCFQLDLRANCLTFDNLLDFHQMFMCSDFRNWLWTLAGVWLGGLGRRWLDSVVGCLVRVGVVVLGGGRWWWW